MQLTKLDIKGFKSFGDRVTIQFDQGVTGVVGPNGSGKSNVVDAIRWVLGEQRSRALRSDKMENVIFNGTKKRKPLQMAEVGLTFKNTKNLLPTEYGEVSIVRRYYRSGESEYLLNGVTCRRKDITNLFLDTGITSNSYAIIELKMVDDLLTDRENSRRGLFEEAAGISKFKIRKKETLRKLEGTDEDLNRVEDLLHEMERNMRNLERQAKQTERYYELKEEYKQVSISLALKSSTQQRQQHDNLRRSLQEQEQHRSQQSTLIGVAESRREQGEAQLVTEEKTLKVRQKALNDHTAKIRSYESEHKINSQRLNYLNSRSDKLRAELDEDRKSNERAAFSIDSLTKELEATQQGLGALRNDREQAQTHLEEQRTATHQLRDAVDEKDELRRQQQNHLFQLEKDLEVKEMQLRSLTKELSATATDSSEHSASIEEFDQRQAELTKQVQTHQQAVDKLKAQDQAQRDQQDSHTKRVELVKQELAEVNRKLDATRNEYNLTKSLVDNLEGFPEAIKFLRKSKNWSREAPLLSDILTTDEAYRICIENFLEPYMNYYVVQNRQEAIEAVSLLSDAAKGRANFFILDSFQGFRMKDADIEGSAVPASEVVEYDDRYRHLVAYMLDGVYILPGDQTPPDNHDSRIYLSQSGKYISRPYSMAGGSVGLFEGKRIGRARNLEKLEKQLAKLEKQAASVERSLEEEQTSLAKVKSTDLRPDLEEAQQQLSQSRQELATVESRSEQLKGLLANQAMKREDMEAQARQLEQELKTEHPRAAQQKQDLAKLTTQLAADKEQLAQEQEELNTRSAAFNEVNLRFHQSENKAQSLERELTYKQDSLESSKQRIARNQEELKNIDEEIKTLVAGTENADDVLVALYEEKDSLTTAVNEAEKTYYGLRNTISEADKEAREQRHNRDRTDELIMQLKDQLSDTKLALQGLAERLQVEFQVKLDSAEDPMPQVDLPGLEEKQQRAKERLEKLGDINPLALEAYKEAEERHTFIVTQRDDLLKAKDDLLDTIRQIDETAQVTFMEAFGNIKENFVKVFRSLFTAEDECDLQLVNPDDPLESKIEILAKPKGKRPLTINQLSGGEKTLTAISLLFAIYLLKPAPFCIFDEVDAPLDDANIDKFNNIIKEFSQDSQFIIVTHNKRTMSATDIIYGITMVEQGVSRVVPVDLSELQ